MTTLDDLVKVFGDVFYTPEDEEIHKAVTEAIPALLVGGYCRDMLLGRAPKDLDFMVLEDDDDPEFERALLGLIARIAIDDPDYPCRWFARYSGEHVCIARFFVRVPGGVREVNLLRHTTKVPTCPLEAVEQFNYTINQCYYCPDTRRFKWVGTMQEQLAQQAVAVWNATGREVEPLHPKYPEKFPGWKWYQSWAEALC